MKDAPFSVAVIGGGLAGLAAAEAACRYGLQVEIFEQSAVLGGRAGSFVEPFNARLVDFGQHAAMGCCTNFLDFCRRTGVAGCFRREKKLHFLGPDHRLHDFSPSRWLPAPFHFLFGLKQLDFIPPGERRGIVTGVKNLIKTRELNTRGSEATFGEWLHNQRQSPKAVDYFWSIIIQGALGESVDHVSFAAARKVFVDGFISSRAAGEMILANQPLGEIFDRRVGQWLADRGVAIHGRTRVMWLEMDESSQLTLILPEGDARAFDAAILAVPWHQAGSLFPPSMLDELPSLGGLQNLHSGGIAAVHLWFDRLITDLSHAILVGRVSQWIFQTPSIPCSGSSLSSSSHSDVGTPTREEVPKPEHDIKGVFFYQVVVSATHRLEPIDKESLLDRVLTELADAFPDFRSAQLVHSRVVQQPQAIFTMPPGVQNHRPSHATALNNLFLAGDWTDTGWPATMESAVRSGYLAVEGLLNLFGRAEKIVVPDLPKEFLVKIFLRG
jgi:squalene-associated FAD-dependent desaturase